MQRLLSLVYEVLDYALAYRGTDGDNLPAALWDIIDACASAIDDHLESLEDDV